MKTGFASLWLACCTFAGPALGADAPERGFREPPPSARPWVYWFWLNGNITSNGVTADLTDVAQAGENRLEVRVVNLWPNRLIGDEQLPEDSERTPDGTLKGWPFWVQEGKPSPTGRHTFTSWRIRKKHESLQVPGLLGPVTLRTTHLQPIPLP
jgi:hypothetical protein